MKKMFSTRYLYLVILFSYYDCKDKILKSVLVISGHYCPNGTKVSSQYPCPAGTFNNGTGLRSDTECSDCLGNLSL